jgi:hypothetical protein
VAHKEENKQCVDLKNKQCEADVYEKFASFGSVSDRVVRFCGSHKEEGHANLMKTLREAAAA